MERRTVKAKTQYRFGRLPKDYEGLCRVLLPRPIRDSVDYDNVAEVAGAMALWEDDFTPGQRDYFDLLCSLMESYDAEHVKLEKVSGLELLRHLMDEHGMNASDLSRILGASRNLGAMILRGDRGLSKANIRKLAEYFHVRPDVFL